MRLFLSLALCLSLSACDRAPGDDDDPGTDTATGSDTGTETGSETETETGSDTQSFSCQDGPSDAGDWWGVYGNDQVSASNPYTTESGIAALIAKAPADGGTTLFDPPLKITGAVVTATGYSPEGTAPSVFWFADKTGAMRTYDPDYSDPNDIKFPEDLKAIPLGSTVSFEVKSLKNYNGELEVDGLDNFTLDASGGSKIWVQDLTDGTKVDYAEHGRNVVHFWGEITEVQGPCGTPTCYALEHGDSEYVLRVKKDYLVGDCVEVVHTVGVYRSDIQFDVGNWDSLRTY